MIKKIDDKESLLKTEFSDSGKTVEDELTNVISKLGENIVIKKLKLLTCIWFIPQAKIISVTIIIIIQL